MPIRVKRKMCTIYKRTEEEKRSHNMVRELEEARKKLASTTEELDRTKKELKSISKDIMDIKAAMAGNSSKE